MKMFTVLLSLVLVVSASATAPVKVADASKRLECDDQFIKHASWAWLTTRLGSKHQEAGFRVDVVDGTYLYYDAMGDDGELHMYIPVNTNTVAIFHVHPNTGIGHPVGKDFASQVPNYVFSRDGLFVTVPSASAETSVSSTYKQLSGCFVGKEYLR